MPHLFAKSRQLRTVVPLFVAALGVAAAVHAQPTFTKVFTPDPIGPGSTSTLRFDIVNGSASPVSDLAFIDVLPAAVVIATPPSASTTCAAGTVSAPAGGTAISLSGGGVGANGTCTVTVNVTSSTPGAHTNTSGDLTSSAGNSGTASDTLTVTTALPGFFKSFAPSSIPLGGRSTLTFIIDNSANASGMDLLSFTDILPTGLLIASPAQASTDCGTPPFVPTLIANPGTGTIDFSVVGLLPSFPAVGAGSTCMVVVDVVATGAGLLGNTSSDLDTNAGSAGKASATLNVTVTQIALIKSFTDDPTPPGGIVSLQFTILNRDRDFSATGVTFTDDLDTTLSGLAPSGPLPSTPCGAGSSLGFASGVLTLSGGLIAPQGSCTFSVSLLVPAAAAPGVYPNSTSAVAGNVNGSPVIGNVAADDLFVSVAPTLTKSFTDDPVAAGGTVTLEFTITNTSSTSSATDISFTDVFDVVITGATTVPPAGFCGMGSTALVFPLNGGPAELFVSDGSLAPAGSCTFSIVLNVAPGAPVGVYPNTTSSVTATVGAATVTGNPASDDLVVVGAPSLIKEFTDDPANPGGTVTLEFTLSHSPFAAANATGITFTDNLAAALSGLMATGLPLNDVCGTGSQIDGTTNLTFMNGTLAPGASCTFGVTLAVPAGAPSGAHTNDTSNVMATVSGLTVVGNAATDDLLIAGLTLTKSFTNDPVLPGATVDLMFTISNVSTTDTATNVFFQDNLEATLMDLVGDGVIVNDVCGAGNGTITWSTAPGGLANSLMTFSGGSLGPGLSCNFTVTLQVPAAAVSDTYPNSTNSFQATVGGSTVSFPNGIDTLVVDSNLLVLTKQFTDDPVTPGSPVTLQFTIENLDLTNTITSIGFTDDLDAALSGLVATGLPIAACGGTLSGTSVITLSGASLGPGANCTFSVTLLVPMATPFGTVANNTTSQVDGLIGALPVAGDPASDDLVVDFLTFTKAFDGPTVAGGTPQLTFSITNLDPSSAVSDLQFSDNLNAVLAGLVATGLPQNDVCGMGSMLSGTSNVQLTGGNLLAGGSCSFTVDLQVPAAAASGSFLNTTSDLLIAGLPTANPATDNLLVEPAPLFSKSFAPATIVAGANSTLTFTIDNGASALGASALDFTDNLPAGLMVASPSGATNGCSGTLTAGAGTGVISLSGGSVGAGLTCTITVDITGAVPGAHANTSGDLTSSSGNSGAASDTLTVTSAAAPIFSKAFASGTIFQLGVTTLTFTIDNTMNLVPATSLDFTDNLPAGLVVASPANAFVGCVGGTLTAVPGTGVISYTGGTAPASSTCTIQVDVTAATTGTFNNVTGNLTSSQGLSGPASATLVVTGSVLQIPTLSLWGVLLLVGLLGVAAIWLLRMG